MGQQDRVELGRVEGERDPVADRLVRAALEHAAVDEDLRALGDQQELRAGDGGGAAEELDVHAPHGDSARLRPRILRADGHRSGGALVRGAAGRPRRHRRRAQPRGARRSGRRLDDAPWSAAYRARRRAFEADLDELIDAGRRPTTRARWRTCAAPWAGWTTLEPTPGLARSGAGPAAEDAGGPNGRGRTLYRRYRGGGRGGPGRRARPSTG